MCPVTRFEVEVREQPGVLARGLRERRAACETVAAAIHAAAPSYVVVAARGSSDNAARYAQYALGAENRLSVALAAPALFTAYARPPRLDGAVVVGISQSGQSPDVVAVLAEARRQGALTIAITNAPASPLAAAAVHVLDVGAGEETAVAATKTYTAQLHTIAMLSAALAGEAARWDALAAVPDAVAAALATLPAVRVAAPAFAQAQRSIVLGRGFNHATAWEIALKLKETSYVACEPSSWADFRHGPIAVVEPGFPALVVAPRGAFGDEVLTLVDDLRARGARVAAISDRADVLARVEHAFALPSGVPEWLSPLVAIVPGQLFALALAEARGHDPDRPRGLQKVTRTT